MAALSFKEQVTAKAFITNENRAISKRRSYLSRPFFASLFKKKLYNLAFLAYQCEYIWSVSDAEKEKLAALKQNILDGAFKTDKQLETALLTLSCYELLHQSEVRDIAIDFEKKFSSPSFSDHITRVIYDFDEEEKIKKEIKSFGSISDDVSQKVRAQYEENPYPRWINPERLLQDSDGTKDKLEILVAGCGTGKQLYTFCKKYPNSDITAIDLSLSSLAYAKRKMGFYGIKNVTLLHGDILEVAQLGKKFDVIISTGVLHHMKEPMAGWKSLVNVLKPEAKCIISLYSYHARQAVRLVRGTIIEPQAMEYGIENMRKVRKHVKGLPSEHDLAPLTIMNDFYSTSECRDLIFHVQEHQFDIPQIKECLNELGLEFVSFLRKDTRLDGFFHQHQSPEDFKNLDLWNDFEKKNPLAFIGMYNFICKKKS